MFVDENLESEGHVIWSKCPEQLKEMNLKE